MQETQVEIKFLDEELYVVEGGFQPPQYATEGSAAVDLRSAENALVLPGKTLLIKTGIAISILNNAVCAMILPRSGLGSRGLVLGNTVGLIDSDYQGELLLTAYNRLRDSASDAIEIRRGDRIAQMVFVPVYRASWAAVKEFAVESARNIQGFGSTGV